MRTGLYGFGAAQHGRFAVGNCNVVLNSKKPIQERIFPTMAEITKVRLMTGLFAVVKVDLNILP